MKIKAISASGRKRGNIDQITKDGNIEVKDEKFFKFVTPQIRKKIELALDLIYGTKRLNNSVNIQN